jgi:hypothetical protein
MGMNVADTKTSWEHCLSVSSVGCQPHAPEPNKNTALMHAHTSPSSNGTSRDVALHVSRGAPLYALPVGLYPYGNGEVKNTAQRSAASSSIKSYADVDMQGPMVCPIHGGKSLNVTIGAVKVVTRKCETMWHNITHQEVPLTILFRLREKGKTVKVMYKPYAGLAIIPNKMAWVAMTNCDSLLQQASGAQHALDRVTGKLADYYRAVAA